MEWVTMPVLQKKTQQNEPFYHNGSCTYRQFLVNNRGAQLTGESEERRERTFYIQRRRVRLVSVLFELPREAWI